MVSISHKFNVPQLTLKPFDSILHTVFSIDTNLVDPM